MKNPTVQTLFLLTGFFAALVGSASANGANYGYCAGEVLRLVEPVIVVVDGPGDAATQQELWSGKIQFEGPLSILYGNKFLDMEEIP